MSGWMMGWMTILQRTQSILNRKEEQMVLKRLLGSTLAATLILGAANMAPLQAHAAHPSRYYDNQRHAWVDYKTGKIIKGGLVGAGIGAGAGLLLDKNVGKSALAGAGIGAGAQAVRYSDTLRRHPIVKTGAYGALAGAGVSAATGKKLGKGALVGGALGAGLGALTHY
jgi:hypothetical protein